MKKYIVILKTEFGSLKQFSLHCTILVLIFFFSLSFFGVMYGQQYELNQSRESIITGNIAHTSLTNLDELNSLEGIKSYMIYSNLDEFLQSEDDPLGQELFIASLSENYEFASTLEGRTFTLEEQQVGENVVITPYSYSILNDITIGKTIEINDRRYEVIGIGPYMDYESFIIPKKNLFEHFGQDHTIKIYTEENFALDSVSRGALIAQVEDYLQAPVIDEETAEQDITEIMRQGKVVAIILFSLAIINILYIYSYILERRKKLINIYRLNGATIGFIVRSLLVGLLMVYTFSFGIAYGLLILFQKVFSHTIIGSQTFMITLDDLMTFFIIMLLIYLLPLFIYIRKWLKNSIVYALKGGN